MGMAQRKPATQYVPLADRDFGLRGFEFEGDLVVIDAMRRWAIKPEGTYEDFLRRAYWTESIKADGCVVDISRDAESPLTLDQVMLCDPTVLAVRYDDGDFSKHYRGTYGAGTQVVMGDECPACHSFERDTKGKCVVCTRDAQHAQQAAYRLAHPEIEEARLAKQKAREEKWAAQTLAAELEAEKKREARAIRQDEVAARKAARHAAEQEAVLARQAEKQAERIRARREREAQQPEKPIKQAVENKFEGKPCRTCGSTTRYIKDRCCVACSGCYQRRRKAKLREKQPLAEETV